MAEREKPEYHSLNTMRLPREPPSIGTNALSIRVERLTSDDMLFVAAHGGGCRRHLRFASCQDFLRHHTAGLCLSACPARGQAQHPQGYDALRLQTDLPSLQTER